jgi:glycogen operon protein
VNFITAHDGFTLRDLVSYNEKHNEANGENGNDGESHNRSWNCGVEGPTDDPAVRKLRLRQARNFLTTLMLSQGVPMLLHGDELGRTQQGNNNVYAQDNELAWVDWDLDEDQRALLQFTSQVIGLRKSHAVFRRRRFFVGDPGHGGASDLGDIEWFNTDGHHMTEADWQSGYARTLTVFLNGDAIPEPDNLGRRISDDHFLMLFNAHSEPVEFTLPPETYGLEWQLELQTDDIDEPRWKAASTHLVEPHSVVVLSAVAVPEEEKVAAKTRAQQAVPRVTRAARTTKPGADG